jgi:hypothetical protein
MEFSDKLLQIKHKIAHLMLEKRVFMTYVK